MGQFIILSEQLIPIGFTLIIILEGVMSYILFLGKINLLTVVLFSIVLLLFSIAVLKNIKTGTIEKYKAPPF